MPQVLLKTLHDLVSNPSQLFGGISDLLLPTTGDDPALALSNSSFPFCDPVRNNGAEPVGILVSPPLPRIDICVPVPASWLESMTHADFWLTHVASFRSLRPPQPLSASARSVKSEEWRVIDPSLLSTVLQNAQVLDPIAQLIAMDPAGRAAQADTMNADLVRRIYNLLQRRNRDATRAAALAEVCERDRSTPNYVNSIRHLIIGLETVIIVHNEVVEFLPFLENRATTEYIGRCLSSVSLQMVFNFQTDTRNECQSFNRGIRRVIDQFSDSGDPEVNNAMQSLAKYLEGVRLKLVTLGPGSSGVDPDTGAVTALQQEEILDELRFTEAINAIEQGDQTTCEDRCNKLISTFGCNLFIKSYARGLLGWIDMVPLEERVNSLSRSIETLKVIKAPPKWANMFIVTISKFANKLQDLQVELQQKQSRQSTVIAKCCRNKSVR